MKITWLSDSGGRTLPGRRRSLLVHSLAPGSIYTPLARPSPVHIGAIPAASGQSCIASRTQPSMNQHVEQYPSYLAGGYCGMADSKL